MRINQKIFKTYDIRGLYPKEVNEKFAYLLGRAMVKFLGAKAIIVGRDKIFSSKILFEALSQGIIDQGANVINIGEVTTPIFNFTVAEYNICDLGIMITASHLVKKYNGFKLADNKAIPLDINQRLKIKKLIEEENFKPVKKKGNLEKIDLIKNYYQKIFSLLETPFIELDKISKQYKFKVSYDRDGDRIIFFDEQRERVQSDLITALLVKYLLKDNKSFSSTSFAKISEVKKTTKDKSEKIVFTVNSSKVVEEEIEKAGGKAVVSKIGHYFLKKKMKKENALFGGELSGHYYFRDFYFCECPDLVLLKILEIIRKEKKTLRELISPLKKYYNTGEINLKTGDKNKKVKEIEKYYSKPPFSAVAEGNPKKSFLDGLTCEFKDWWFNLRPSNTENILRLVIETKTKEILEQKKSEIIKLICK